MDLIARNEQFIRDLFAASAHAASAGGAAHQPPRHAFMYQPTLVGVSEVGDYSVSQAPIAKWLPWVVENFTRQVIALEHHQDDSVPVAGLGTGTQLFAQAFGCSIHVPPDSNPCALPLVDNAAAADALVVPDIWKSRCLYRVFELGALVRRELGPTAVLGPCDFQTGFDIANLIWEKSDLLVAMIENPDAVQRLAAKCATLLKTFLIELRKEFPNMSPCHCPGNWVPPELGPWVSNDEVGTMSPAMFEQFCLPELTDLSTTFGGIGMHCCANAEHQFAGFRKIPNLYAFNRVAAKQGPYRDSYLPLLDYFAGPGSPVHCLAWLSDATIEQLIELAPAGTRFVFQLKGADSDDAAAAWLERGRGYVERRAQQGI